MNDSDLLPASKIQPRRPPASPQWPEIPEPPHGPGRRGGAGRRLLGLAVLAVVVAALAFGAWRHFQQSRDVAATAEQQAAFMPSVRVEQVVQRHGRLHVSLPGTTLASGQGDTDRYTLQAQQHATQAAQNSAAAMQAQLQYTNQQKIYQQVVAPFDGVVTQRNIDVGSLITANATSGTAMFTVVQSGVIRVWVYVPQDAAFGVKPGIEAIIRVPAMPNLTFHGKVTRIADALQPGTRTLLTEIDIPNPDGSLQPGVYCTVELRIPRQAPALIVPASAIIFNQNGIQVAVVEDGVAHLRKIAITTDAGTEVEVNDGVTNGDQVILQPPVNLADGDKVHAISEPPAATP